MQLKTAEILCVGTELLIGDIVNTNAAFLSARLAEMGIAQYRQSVVGDNPERLEEAVRQALPRCDLLILTGGLGPTYDDLTKQITARALGRGCHTDPDCLARVEAFYRKRNIPMHDSDMTQALVIDGGFAFPNNYGSAPAIGVTDEEAGKTVILLPGPPREMRPIFDEEVRPYLERFTDSVIVSHNIRIIGMGESTVDSCLSELMQNAVNPSVAPYCGEGEVRLRVSARHTDRQTAEKMCADMIDRIRQTPVAPYIYGIDIDIATAVVRELKERSFRIAAAESCTGGRLAACLTDVPGASAVLEGSAVTYANRIKQQFAFVSQETLDRFGAVSAQTAAEMCRGIRRTMGADVGVGITGYAGPDGGTESDPVGTVYVGISVGDRTQVERLTLSGTRDYIRTLAVKRALSFVLLALRELPFSGLDSIN